MKNDTLCFINNSAFKNHLKWLKSSKRKDIYNDKMTNAINEAKSYLSENGRTLVAMSLYGSQNYNLDIEGVDIDNLEIKYDNLSKSKRTSKS